MLEVAGFLLILVLPMCIAIPYHFEDALAMRKA